MSDLWSKADIGLWRIPISLMSFGERPQYTTISGVSGLSVHDQEFASWSMTASEVSDGGSSHVFEQLPGRNVQPERDAFQIIDRDVALAPLDRAEIGAVHLDCQREILLAQTTLMAHAPDIGGDDRPKLAGMGSFHRPKSADGCFYSDGF